jgi:hypothetical protein
MVTYRRIHAERSFAAWTDAEGAFCFQGRDTADRGALLLAHLDRLADRLQREARAGEPSGNGGRTSTPEPPDSRAAHRADALLLLCTGRRPAWGPTDSASGVEDPVDPTCRPMDIGAQGPVDADQAPGGHTVTGRGTSDGDDGSVRSEPRAAVIVRVDLAALRRGRTRTGELCEINGQGPVPVPIARYLAEDSLLSAVFVEAGDIRAVHHFGRTINARLRTALRLRDRHCVVPGCTVGYGLEIDHVVAMERGGPTTLDNLALLCHSHHRRKTFEGWQLSRTGPSDEDPEWRFVEQPEFGQEPGLGSGSPPQSLFIG